MGRGGRGVRAVSDTSIEITFMYRGVRCRERITLKPTSTNLKKAEQHKAAIEHAISIGTFDYLVTFPGSARAAKFAPEAFRETMNGFLTWWLEGKKKYIASSTFEGYRKLVTLRLVPALGDTMLVDLKRKAVRDWLDTLEVSNKTLRNIQTRHTYASMMLSAGKHPMWVAKQMGHTDWTMIARVYGRWMPTPDQVAGEKAVQMWTSDGKDNNLSKNQRQVKE